MTEERMPDYQEVLQNVLVNLVNNPQDVKVERRIDEMGVLLSIRVNPSDMGLLIGRKGGTAKALRTLIRVIGMKSHARVNIKVEEPPTGSRVLHKEPAKTKTPGPGLDDVINELKAGQ